MPLPKYHQIYLVLREQLHEGRFAEGLPGELALMAQFGVARVTVRRALEQLAGEGLIARNPGRRTRALRAAGPATARSGEAAWSAPTSPACSRTWSPWACTPRSR
jgi:GntR family transcriptional regulator